MKKLPLFLLLFTFLSLTGCGRSANITPINETPYADATAVMAGPSTPTPEVFISRTQAIPSTPAADNSPTSESPSEENILVTLSRITFEIPISVASGASGAEVPAFLDEELAYWQKTPGHFLVLFNDYDLGESIHQPQVLVYPATDYAILSPAAFESMHRLRNIMSDVVPLSTDQLPGVPFLNAQQLFASNIEKISFQNGSGIRFLTEYGQYPAPVNNQELFYLFLGFSEIGDYYIVAIFPITAPGLGGSSDPASAIPIDGVAYPDMSDPDADWDGYYAAAVNLLETTPPNSFAPVINQLDALVQSIWIAP